LRPCRCNPATPGATLAGPDAELTRSLVDDPLTGIDKGGHGGPEVPPSKERPEIRALPAPEKVMDAVARVLFVLGLAVFAFGYGFIARSWKLPPYHELKPLGDAVAAATRYFTEAGYITFSSPHPRGGTTLTDRAAAAPGLTFIPRYDGERFTAELLDLDGQVVHRWRTGFREVWGDRPTHVQFAADDSVLAWHGTHLYPDGSLLLNFEGQLFPFGGGLVKLDRDSRVVWKLARNTHHSVTVAQDGTIWVPSLNYRPEGMPELPGREPWFYEDTILKVSPDGEVLDELSVLLAMRSLPGLLPPRGDSFDPTHLNDVELVTPGIAARFPMLRPGDLLVSLRNISAIVAIDPATRTAHWAMAGPFRRQHDPDLLPNGHILLYDNLGGDPRCGRSRILELDPVTQAVAWSYDGCAGGDRFDSEAWGEQQPLPNGNVLVSESFGGRVFEVTRQPTPRIVWSYVNQLGPSGEGPARGGVVGSVRRFAPGELPFAEGREVAGQDPANGGKRSPAAAARPPGPG
jgi:Arylsulfotransferase (ASST)